MQRFIDKLKKDGFNPRHIMKHQPRFCRKQGWLEIIPIPLVIGCPCVPHLNATHDTNQNAHDVNFGADNWLEIPIAGLETEFTLLAIEFFESRFILIVKHCDNLTI
jgi:hypothetical protein